MTKLQLGVIASALLLFFVLYFGCDTKPKRQQQIEKSRALTAESTDVSLLLDEAKKKLSPVQVAELEVKERLIDDTSVDSSKVSVLKQLSGAWYELGFPDIAGYYAQNVAEVVNTDTAWSIAGTTFLLCMQQTEEAKVKSFCSGRAVQAFENAISLAPEEVRHRVNLALCYTEVPPTDNPMRGITMLLELNREHPNSVVVLNQLARLAIKTGQFEKAVERLEHALSVEPDNTNANCLMAQALQGAGQAERAKAFAAKCPQ